MNKTLYNPAYEHDACGVGLIANVKGVKYRDVVENALKVLENMAHRGAEGADSKTGDGAGIMVQIPHEFILLNGIPVPEPGRYGVGMLFMPKDEDQRKAMTAIVDQVVAEEGLKVIQRRQVPVDSDVLGDEAREAEPYIEQVFITGSDDRNADVAEYEQNLESRLYRIGKKIERRIEADSAITDKKSAYIVSLSTRTLIYKGMLTSGQLRQYFPDLRSQWFTSAMALVHSRFSTNTFPSWRLAQPFRLIAHNGEINTIKGNRLWMKTREAVLQPEKLGDISELSPILQPDMSDSASLDNTVDFFVRSGMSLPHVLAMLIPESIDKRNPMSSRLNGFYEYHSIFMEPWDGPATVLFSDGRYVGGMLDRNGLRPCRYTLTTDGMLIMASETGVMHIDPVKVKEKGRLHPGEMIIVDLAKGDIMRNDELKLALANQKPYKDWLKTNRVLLSDIRSGRHVSHDVDNYERRLKAFGYSNDDIDRLLLPMANNRSEPSYAMGNDTPPAVLSGQPRRLFDYFRQQFAQVTNPPIDALRETMVMSLKSFIGAVKGNVLAQTEDLCKVVELSTPVITNTELDLLKNLSYKGFRTITLDMTFAVADGEKGLRKALAALCEKAEQAVDEGCNYIILSDKNIDKDHASVPSLIATSAIHHHLIAKKKRSQTALIVESGEVLETMHVALLIGYGASAVNPYMAFAILNTKVKEKSIQLDYTTAKKYYVEAVNKGLLKIMSKMGISDILSYRGAKLFDTLGLSQNVLDDYFGGGVSPIEGLGIDDIAADAIARHRSAWEPDDSPALEHQGKFAWRKGGEKHVWTPAVIKALQKSVADGDYDEYEKFVSLVEADKIMLRDLLDISSDRSSVPVSEVESEESIMRRFVAGAMSFGAISKEAHEDIACAMNSIGATSNTGEGGELAERFTARRGDVSLNSAVKQVASGRFGVTAGYLVNAAEIQIKVAQGAKPGEGGQLPGFKVDEMIARTRKSIPGITLISPPPHHDIYSIEDLSQLIHDLRSVNPRARISVKLVSESGIGTIAAGVVKAKADTIVVSGAEGGTGASPLSSVFHAGMPMETGLAEVQQTLMLNDLRHKVRIQVDGQMKTGRDVVVSALLGAEEFGFSTSLLIALGCIMDRQCHTNKCCAGIATQCAELRAKYKGNPEKVVTYLRFVARHVRSLLASMGYRSLDEITGQTHLLVQKPGADSGRHIDMSRLLGGMDGVERALRSNGLTASASSNPIDDTLISATTFNASSKLAISIDMPIANTDRSVGARLSGEIERRISEGKLPADDAMHVNFFGSAGQSFGAFLTKGLTFNLIGDANDYLGKGLSGGRIILRPDPDSAFSPAENIIAGNTLLYGATSGEVFINGIVGERFCVRNSGAVAVAEGVGNHCCEYMTGGCVVVLGPTGRNFAAGMSGGVAYVHNPGHNFDLFCNMELVELTLVEGDSDRNELRSLIEKHLKYTGSPRAKALLDDWDNSVKSFVKITPIEYKKILESVNNTAE